MIEHLSHDEYIASVRARAAECARSVLAARVTLIEGIRRLLALLYQLDDPSLEAVHRILIAIDSETDHLPVGPARGLWAPAALAATDREVAQVEAFYRAEVAQACKQVVDHLEKAV